MELATPGQGPEDGTNPDGVASLALGTRTRMVQPLQGWISFAGLSQGSLRRLGNPWAEGWNPVGIKSQGALRQCRRRFRYPNGIASFSPALPMELATPGQGPEDGTNPDGVASLALGTRTRMVQPLQGWISFAGLSQGSLRRLGNPWAEGWNPVGIKNYGASDIPTGLHHSARRCRWNRLRRVKDRKMGSTLQGLHRLPWERETE